MLRTLITHLFHRENTWTGLCAACGTPIGEDAVTRYCDAGWCQVEAAEDRAPII